MKLIDRLIHKVNNGTIPGQERLIQGFLNCDNENDKFILECCLWDGVKGSGGRSIISEHTTKEKAMAHFEEMLTVYPNYKTDPNLLIDDLKDEGCRGGFI